MEVQKNQIPQWYKDQTQYDLVLSNDMDSLLSCNIVTAIKGWQVRYYYDMEHLYGDRDLKESVINKTANERVWVDVAIATGAKAFDNHVSRMSAADNGFQQTINPNMMAGVSSRNYADKYGGSTALMLYWLYDIPLPHTVEGKALLLSIDSAYLGHYHRYERIREANDFFIRDTFGLSELYDLMEKKPQIYFDNIARLYHINADFTWNNGMLQAPDNLQKVSDLLEIDLMFPEIDTRYYDHKNYEVKTLELTDAQKQVIWKVSNLQEKIFTIAFTYKNNARYSVAA